MRLHRLRLEDFRGVADREVVFATTGITVVDGPNEVGKSSLGDALDMVLRRHDSSEARDVREAAPAGRDVGPFVEVEISTGPYRFVFAKRWLRGHMTRLDVLEPVRRQLTGREAHDAVEAMLAETLDADLWSALRVAQGTADGPVDVHTRSLARVLDGAMGVEATGGDEQLVERIQGERLQYWTPTGRPRGERVELAREVAELAERDAEIVRQLEDLVDAATRVEDLGVRRAEMISQRSRAESALADVTGRVAAVADARRELVDAERRAESARAAHVSAEADVDRRHELIDDVDGARADLDKLRLDLDRSVAAAADSRAQESQAAAALEAATCELTALDVRVRSLESRRDRLSDLGRLDVLRERIRTATTAVAAQQAAHAHLASLPQVDAAALTALESAATAVVVATARLDGASTRIDLDALASLDLTIDDVSQAIAGGTHHTWTAAESLTFELADQIRLTVSPGEGAAELLAAADRARRSLDALCAELSVAGTEEARSVHEQRRSAEADVAAASAELARALGPSTLDALVEDAAALEARLSNTASADLLDGSGVDMTGVAVSDEEVEPELESARALLSSLRTRRDDLAADAEHHRERAQRARMEDTTLAGRIEQADSHHERVAARLATARVAADDAALDVVVASCLSERESAEMALGAARRDLDALHPDALEDELHKRRAHLQSLEGEISSTSSEIDRLQVRLDLGGEQGLASELDDIRTRHAHLQRRRAGLERNAAAARRLHETVEAHRDAARRRYAAPFREELERLGRLVFGPGLQLELDDDLHVVRRTLDGVVLDVDQLSVGAREQLGLLARLACASIVSTDGGAPVMFDDVLGHSDPDRVVAMGRALAASARDGQVIITTCAPERYESLDAARVTLT